MLNFNLTCSLGIQGRGIDFDLNALKLHFDLYMLKLQNKMPSIACNGLSGEEEQFHELVCFRSEMSLLRQNPLMVLVLNTIHIIWCSMVILIHVLSTSFL